MASLVFRYGLHAPREGAALVSEQMRLAHRYRNTLVEIERGRRAAVRAVDAEEGSLAPLEAAVRAADADCERLASAIRRQRKATRARSESSTDRKDLADARASKSETVRLLRDRREVLASVCRDCRKAKREERPCPHASEAARKRLAALDAINERAGQLIRSAREHSGVFWGTYLLVERAMQASRSAPEYELDGVTPHDPPFVAWQGDGVVGVQLQGGLPVDKALGCTDTRLQIQPPALGAWDHPSWSERHRRARTAELRLRIGSTETGAPVWGRFVLDMHRPIPKGSVIKWATVIRKARGPHSEWALNLTLDLTAADRAMPDPNDKAVAIDVGWRVMGDGLRVATWVDSEGQTGEVRLDAPTIRALRQADELRSERDRRFDGVRLALAWWMAWQPEVPDWLREGTVAMSQWRSQRRMVSLWNEWAEQRFDGDDRPWAMLTAWYWRDHHLWEQETQSRPQGLRRRRELYRVFAAKLAETYGTIVLEQFDLRRVAERAPVGLDKAENETARSNRQLAAVSELRSAVINAAASRGRQVARMPAADTTRTCASCGLVEAFDAASAVCHACTGCGTVWDQDENSGAVLLARWRERPGDAKFLGGARTGEKDNETAEPAESRWVRARRLRQQKDARLAAAREEGGSAAK